MEVNDNQFKSKTSIRGVNLIYLLSAVLFITVGAFAQSRSFNIGIIVTEFLLIAMPALLYVVYRRGSIKREMRFNRLHFVDGILVIVIFLFGYPVALFINLLGNIFVSFFGKLIPSPIPTAGNINEYFILLLIVAGSAGLCEEILFRGLILRGYEKLGMWKSITFTATLFAMLHMNIQNILGPLFLGILLGYVVYVTDSIYAGMLGHFMNNTISVSLTFVMMQFPALKNAAAHPPSGSEQILGLFAAAILLGFAAILPGIFLVLCMKSLRELNRERRKGLQIEGAEFERLKLRNILKSPKISWPIYISFAIFCFYSAVEFTYVATGKSLFDIIF